MSVKEGSQTNTGSWKGLGSPLTSRAQEGMSVSEGSQPGVGQQETVGTVANREPLTLLFQ